MKYFLLLSMTAITLFMTGCLSPSGDTIQQQQASSRKEIERTLAELYRVRPEAREKIEKSAAYIVFNSIAFDLVMLPVEYGWAVAYNQTGNRTSHFKFYASGLGPGIGGANIRYVYVFDSEYAFVHFLGKHWKHYAQTNAVWRFKDEESPDVSVRYDKENGITAYKIDRKGLHAQAAILLFDARRNDRLSDVK